MLARYLHTIRYLKPVQVYGRVWFRLRRPKVVDQPTPNQREVVRQSVDPATRVPSMLSPNRFRFLNEEHDVTKSSDWDNPSWSKLWRYNLHYFDDLNAEGADARTKWHCALIERWIQENPIGVGSGWEPYPISLRIVNWIKWVARGNPMSQVGLHSLAHQARSLTQRLEFHILGNHLFANAKALVFAGIFFAGPEAEQWLSRGEGLLSEQIPEQVLGDGGHFELSPMYHGIILEDILDMFNLYGSYGRNVPADWAEAACAMLGWLDVMTHPDGEIPFFNDAAQGIAPGPQALKSYAARMNIESPSTVQVPIHELAESGYVRVSLGRATAFLDIGSVGPDYLPGHAHADTLSFELSLDGQRIFVNSGVSEYGTGPERLRQRGTSAHNTINVDDQDSSEVWGGFRVARRARIIEKRVHHDGSVVSVEAAHDGYRRLSGRPVHHRSWQFSNGGLVINDEVTGSGDHKVAAVLHVHPDMRAELNEDGTVNISDVNGKLICSLVFSDAGKTTLEPSTYHPAFGVSLPSVRICHTVEGGLPAVIETRIAWQ